MFPTANASRIQGQSFLTQEQYERRQHALECHGRNFWMEGTHRVEHERNDLAVQILRGEHKPIGDPVDWVGAVILVKHDHPDGRY